MASAIQPRSVQQQYGSNELVRGHSGDVEYATAGKPCPVQGPLNNTSLKRKRSHNRFLVWVAHDRNHTFEDNDPKRHRCPLIGCEQDCRDYESLQQHVYVCVRQSRALYRCVECGVEEKIGKYHTRGCKDLHSTTKGGFAKVANSVRQVKELFSRTASKRLSQITHPGFAELEVRPFVTGTERCPSELGTANDFSFFELDGEVFPELEDASSSMYLSANAIYERGVFSELGNCTPTPTWRAPDSQGSFVRGLENGANIRTTANGTLLTQKQNQPQLGQTHFGSKFAEQSRYMFPENRSFSHTRSYQQQAHRQSSHDKFPLGLDQQDPIVEAVSLVTTDDDQYPDTPILSHLAEDTHLGNYFGQTGSSYVSPVSTRENSTTESDPSTPSTGQNSLPITPWRFDFGSPMMSAEPEHDANLLLSQHGTEDVEDFAGSGPCQRLIDYGDGLSNWNVPPYFPQLLKAEKQDNPPGMYQFKSNMGSSATPSPPPPTTALRSPSRLDHTTHSPKSKIRCVCNFEPSGKDENKARTLRRHIGTCKIYNAIAGQPAKPPPLFLCNYAQCGRGYNRSDNLLAHQTKKNHRPDVDLSLLPTSSPSLDPSRLSFELDSREIQPKKIRRC